MSHKKHYPKKHGGPGSPRMYGSGKHNNYRNDDNSSFRSTAPPPGFSPRVEDDSDDQNGVGENKTHTGEEKSSTLSTSGGSDLDFAVKHPLQNRWSMWWDKADRRPNTQNWGASLNKLVDFDTVEDFWRLYNNIVPASSLPPGSDFHLFKYGIEPKWEDKANANGGRWVFTIKNAVKFVVTDEGWLNTILACIGEAYGEYENDVCGAVVSMRANQSRLSLWTRNASDENSCITIGRIFKQNLGDLISDKEKLGYQPHNVESARHNPSCLYQV